MNLLQLFRWMLSVISILSLLMALPSIIIGVVFFVKSSKKETEVEKKKSVHRGLFFILLPFVAFVASLLLYFLLGIIFA